MNLIITSEIQIRTGLGSGQIAIGLSMEIRLSCARGSLVYYSCKSSLSSTLSFPPNNNLSISARYYKDHIDKSIPVIANKI